MAAVWVLLRAYFTAVPGMVWFNVVGIAALGGALTNSNPDAQRAFIGAAAFFLIAFPALFAGNRFRWLASRRTHLLLPGFARFTLASTLLLFVYLAALAGLLAIFSGMLPAATAAAVAFAAVSAVFFFGFVPALPRFLLGSALVGVVAGRGLGEMPDAATLFVAAVVAWFVFGAWVTRRITRRESFKVAAPDWNLPLAMHAPWAQGIGTAEGTLLLGTGDAWSARLARAAFGVLLIPAVLFGAFVLIGGVDPGLVLDRPAMLFLGLAYPLGFQAHLATRMADRRPVVWLRVDGGRDAVRRLVVKVAGAEIVSLTARCWRLLDSGCWAPY